jgi:hypothetical protein
MDGFPCVDSQILILIENILLFIKTRKGQTKVEPRASWKLRDFVLTGKVLFYVPFRVKYHYVLQIYNYVCVKICWASDPKRETNVGSAIKG